MVHTLTPPERHATHASAAHHHHAHLQMMSAMSAMPSMAAMPGMATMSSLSMPSLQAMQAGMFYQTSAGPMFLSMPVAAPAPAVHYPSHGGYLSTGGLVGPSYGGFTYMPQQQAQQPTHHQ